MNKIACFVILIIITSCASDDSVDLLFEDYHTLAQDLEGRLIQKDAVIACAAGSDEDHDLINVFVYIEEGASNVKMYTTNIPNLDQNDFDHYILVQGGLLPVFGSILSKFEGRFTREQWIIVSYEIDGKTKLSSPIRTKNRFQPTYYTDMVSIDQEDQGSPIFEWLPQSEENNAIYFEVVTNSSNELLSGTYTEESQFQYNNLNNVVLNITPSTPPDLVTGEDYIFTVMDVSSDNWVNTVYLLPFVSE